MSKPDLLLEISIPTNYDKLTQYQRRLVREAYTKQQNGLCQHCGEPLNSPPSAAVKARRIKKGLFPPNFFKYPVHLHHSHTTGMTIGAVHNLCNAVLWQYFGE